MNSEAYKRFFMEVLAHGGGIILEEGYSSCFLLTIGDTKWIVNDRIPNDEDFINIIVAFEVQKKWKEAKKAVEATICHEK